MVGKKTRKISLRFSLRLQNVLWKLHVPRTEAPAGQTYFTRYSWVASNEKLKADLGWEPRYTSLATLEIALRTHGLLESGAGAPARTIVPWQR